MFVPDLECRISLEHWKNSLEVLQDTKIFFPSIRIIVFQVDLDKGQFYVNFG